MHVFFTWKFISGGMKFVSKMFPSFIFWNYIFRNFLRRKLMPPCLCLDPTTRSGPTTWYWVSSCWWFTDVCSLSDSISLFIIPLSIFLTKIITSTNNPLLCFIFLWQKIFYAIFSWWEVIETIHCCKLLISLTFYLETFRMKFKSHVIFASKSVFCIGKVFFD